MYTSIKSKYDVDFSITVSDGYVRFISDDVSINMDFEEFKRIRSLISMTYLPAEETEIENLNKKWLQTSLQQKEILEAKCDDWERNNLLD